MDAKLSSKQQLIPKQRNSAIDSRSKSPMKTEPANPIKKRSSIKQDIVKRSSMSNIVQPIYPDNKNTKRIKFSFKKTNDVMANITKIEAREYIREPLDVYLEYLNNDQISTITSEHIYLFQLYKIAKHFDDFDLIKQIIEYINENINIETLPLFILEIINFNNNYTKTFDESFQEMDEEWKGALTNIVNYITPQNAKEVGNAIKDELDLFIMETENLSCRKIDFFMYFLEKIPAIGEKTKVLMMTVFLRHYGRLNSDFNLIVDKYLGRDFVNKNKDVIKEIYGDTPEKPSVRNNFIEGDSIIYKNLMNKTEAKYKIKLAQIEDTMKTQFLEMSRRLDECRAYNEELVQKNLTSEKEIVSLKYNVNNLNRQRGLGPLGKDDNIKSGSELINDLRIDLEQMKNEIVQNSEKVEMLEKERDVLLDANETLTKKLKKNKKNNENLKSIFDELEETIKKNNDETKGTFEENCKEISNFIKLLSNADDNFGNMSKELETIKSYLQKEFSEHENTKKSNNILRLLNSQMEDRIKSVGSGLTPTPQTLGVSKTGGRATASSGVSKLGAKPGTHNVVKKHKSMGFSLKKTYNHSSQQINCVTNISYGTTEIIAAGGTDNLIKLYNLEYWDVIASLSGHRDFISSMIFLNEFQPLLITGSADRTIKIWKLSNNSCIQNIIAHAGPIFCLMYLGKSLFVSGSADHFIKIWNVDNGACFKKIQCHTDNVTSLATFSSMRKNFIASGSWDATIKIWDYEGEDDSISTLVGHESNVNCLLYLENWDKELLVSGSKDKNIKLWNVLKGEVIRTSKGHEGEVTSMLNLTSVEISMIVSGSEDKSLRIWYLASGDCISIVKTDHAFGIKMMLRVDLKRKDNTTPQKDDNILTIGNDIVIKLWQLE